MRIGLTGASGFLGGAIRRLAHQRGHEVVAFSRNPRTSIEWTVETRSFTADRPLDLAGCDAIIHLAGEPVAGIWTERKRRKIFESRVTGTRSVVDGIANAPQPPEVFLCASAIGFYGDGGETELTESSPPGSGFLAETVRAWEDEALRAKGIREVRLRTGVVLGRGGGALPPMLPAFRSCLGATLGDGRQWMSWIHLEDHARLTLFAVEDMNVHGALNATAPWPVRNAEFTRTLAEALHRPAFLRIPGFMLRFLLRGLAAELLESKRVVPAAATEYGFGFKFPELEPALRDLL